MAWVPTLTKKDESKSSIYMLLPFLLVSVQEGEVFSYHILGEVLAKYCTYRSQVLAGTRLVDGNEKGIQRTHNPCKRNLR